MATVGQIDIAMTANTQPLIRNLNAGASAVASFGASVSRMGPLLHTAFAGVATGAATVGLYKLAGAAASAQESINKIDAVFGKQGAAVAETARTMSDAYGIGINSMYDASGKLGSLFAGAGFDPAATAQFSQTMVRLANDLSRFNDTGFATAFDKIRSGLAGESEPLRDFGIFLTEDAVKTKALSMGLISLGQDLTEGAKIQARANLIMEKSGAAIGAAAREADGASAKMEAFWGRVENLQTTLGETFAPTIGEALGGIGTSIDVLGGYWINASKTALEWGGAVNEATDGVVGGLNVVEVAIGVVANAWQSMTLVALSSQSKLASFRHDWLSSWADVADAVDSAFHSVGLGLPFGGMQESLRAAVPILKADAEKFAADVAKEWQKPWASDKVSADFQASRDRMAALRDALGKDALKLPGVTLSGGAAKPDLTSGRAGDRFAGAALFGSKEAASTILRSRYGSRKDSTEDNTKRTADNTKVIADAAREMVQALGGLATEVGDF